MRDTEPYLNYNCLNLYNLYLYSLYNRKYNCKIQEIGRVPLQGKWYPLQLNTSAVTVFWGVTAMIQEISFQ